MKTFTNSELKFGYRDSILKQTTVNGSSALRCADCRVPAAAGPDERTHPLCRAGRVLGVEQGQRAYSNDVRREVLRLRASKGMVLDLVDRDTYSTGSFFTNPIVPADVAEDSRNRTLLPGWRRRPGQAVRGMADRPRRLRQVLRVEEGSVSGGRASLSTKHTLAITNRGSARAADMVAIAREVRAGVVGRFGIELHPEPLLIGLTL